MVIPLIYHGRNPSIFFHTTTSTTSVILTIINTQTFFSVYNIKFDNFEYDIGSIYELMNVGTPLETLKLISLSPLSSTALLLSGL
jgi:hypothetical protein